MAWHVLSSTYFDFDHIESENQADALPEHLLPKIAARLDATIHQPQGDRPSLVDRIGALLYAGPQHWAQARRVYPLLKDGDSVYSAGCDAGLPLALLCALRRRPISFAVAFADPARARPKLLGWILVLLSLRLIAIVTTAHQVHLIRGSFGRGIPVHAIEGQTDCNFFRPPPQRAVNRPPLVASCGVEQRDYETMAAALADLDLQAKVCFASPNRTSKTRFSLPEPMPTTFEFRHFEFVELRSLYQQADVVVLPLIENRYSAGLTTLFEAIACGTPVVATESPGPIQTLIDEGLIIGVPAGDQAALRSAATALLSDPEGSTIRALQARQAILSRYSAASYLDRLEGILTHQEHSTSYRRRWRRQSVRIR